MEKRIPLPNRVNPISFDVFFAKNPLKSPKVSKYQVGREEREQKRRDGRGRGERCGERRGQTCGEDGRIIES